MIKLNDKRVPRPQSSSYKMISRDDWDKLHQTAYDLMYSFLDDVNEPDFISEEQARHFEKFVEQMRRHIALPRDVEAWLERMRYARANEPI